MVKKKIFDIASRQGKFEELPAEFPKKEPPSSRDAVFQFSPAGKIVIPFAVLAISGILSYFFIPHQVKIEIWPEQKNIEETTSAVMAGEVIEEEREVSQSFSATGTKLKSVKARGIIRVYNNYSTASQPLVSTTRFVSDDGKLFRTPKGVVIPGGRYDGGRLVPGFVDIEVAADQAGEEYNINPSTFSIPGFAGTAKYTAFYAKSSEPMMGGLKKAVLQVTQDDLNKAKEIITEKAIFEAEAAVKNSAVSMGYILFEEAIADKHVDFAAAVKAGDEAENFSPQVKVKIRALVFKESDLENFARNYIQKEIPQEEKLADSSLKMEYFLESISLEKQEISLKLAISARSYLAPSETQIKEMVKNKDAKDVEMAIRSFPGIKKAGVEFWPFWISSAPDDLERIEVKFVLD